MTNQIFDNQLMTVIRSESEYNRSRTTGFIFNRKSKYISSLDVFEITKVSRNEYRMRMTDKSFNLNQEFDFMGISYFLGDYIEVVKFREQLSLDMGLKQTGE